MAHSWPVVAPAMHALAGFISISTFFLAWQFRQLLAKSSIGTDDGHDRPRRVGRDQRGALGVQ